MTRAAALKTIRDEHRAYAALLRGAVRLANDVSAGRQGSDLEVFRAMVEYLQAFPDQLHRRKEDFHLFRRLRERFAPARLMLNRVAEEHSRSAALVDALDEALIRCERGSDAFDGFVDALGAYAEFHRRHTSLEEDELLPLAERHLTDADWAAIDAAFRGHTDPLLGAAPEAEIGRLLKRIVMLAPAPLGVRRI
jgi:hemerythrin-like domain-containing protein